jgi:hypothetical protein
MNATVVSMPERRYSKLPEAAFCPTCHGRIHLPSFVRSDNVKGKIRVACRHDHGVVVISGRGRSVVDSVLDCPVYPDVDWDVDGVECACADEPPQPLAPIGDPNIDLWTWADIDGQRVKMPWSLVRTGDRLWNKDFTASNLVVEIEDLHESFDRPNEPCEWYVVNQSVIFFRNQSVVLSEGLRHATHLEIGSTFDNGLIAETVDVYRGAHQWRRVTLNDGGDRTYWLNDFPVHNANRFYVGGSGKWDSIDTTNISATSGGVGGASCPTSADDFTMNSASSATSYTFSTRSDSAPICRNWTVSNPASGTVSYGGNGRLACYGSLDWTGATFTWGAQAMTFLATTTGQTLNFGSNNLFSGGGEGVTFDGVGGGWTLQSALNMSNVLDGLYLRNGTLNLNGQAVTLNSGRAFFLSNTTSTRVLTMGAATVSCGSWDASVTTGLTVNCGTSTITVSSSGTAFAGGGLTYASVVLNGTSAQTLSGTNTFTNLSRTNASGYTSLALSANQTVTGTFTVTGNNATTQRLYVASDTIGTARTITAAVVSLTNVDFEDITAAGAAASFSGTSLGNCGGNTSITFVTSTRYWIHGGSASVAITAGTGQWSTSSGGSTGASSPIPGDTAIFDANSFGATGKTVTIGTASWRLPTINFTGATNSPTLNFDVATSLYGSLTLISGVTFTHGAATTILGRGSNTLTSAGKTFTNAVTLNANSGTMTLADAFTTSAALTVTRGTFSAVTFNVTCTVFSSSNSNTRAVSMGTGTWTVTSTGTVWDISTTTGLTVTCGTSTIAVTNASSSSKTLDFGGKTIFNLTLSGAGSGAYTVQGASSVISGTCTVSNSGSASVTLFGSASMTYNNIDFTGATVTWAGTNAATISGNLTLASGVTVTRTGGITFTSTTSATITSAGKSFGEALTFNGAAGTWTLQDDLTCTAAVTITQGTVVVGAYNLTVLSLSSSNTNTRSLTLTTGKLELTGTGTVLDMTTTTGLTVTCGTSTLKVSDSSSSTKTIIPGGKTFYKVWHSAGTGTFRIGSDLTCNELLDDTASAAINVKDAAVVNVAILNIDGAYGAQRAVTSY